MLWHVNRLIADFRVESRGHPFLTLLAVVYAVIPLLIVIAMVFAIIQRSQLNTEIMRNCQRTAAIADYITDILADATPAERKSPGGQRILELKRDLRAIGSCPS